MAFFSALAAFFSLGVNKGSFLVAFLLFIPLLMILLLTLIVLLDLCSPCTVKETLIKSNNFKLAKSACNFPEDRRNIIIITTHFVKFTDSFLHLNIINLTRGSLRILYVIPTNEMMRNGA